MSRVTLRAVPRRTSTLLLLVTLSGCGDEGARGPAGERGPEGPPGAGAPSVSGVTPGRAFLGDTERLLISGHATAFDASTTVALGAGVTVGALTVASPTALVAELTIDFDAALGPRDVTVTTGAEVLTYAGAFTLESAARWRPRGTVAQGSLILATVENRDFDRPFDTTTEGDGFFTPLTYPNVTVAGDAGFIGDVSSVGAWAAEVSVSIDSDAEPGAASLGLLSGPPGARTSFPHPEALTVAARAPAPLALGTPAEATLDEPYASSLHSLTVPAGPTLLEVTAEPGAPGASLRLFLLPGNGRWGELLAYGAELAFFSQGGAFQLVAWDIGGTGGYTAALTARAVPATLMTEAEPNDTVAEAQLVPSLPVVVQGGTLSASTDVDVLAVDVGAADVGRRLRVRTLPGDPLTDTVLEVMDTDGTTRLGPRSGDQEYLDSLTSPALAAAGRYYVRILPSSFFSAANNTYVAAISLVD